MCGANILTTMSITWLAMAFTMWSIIGARNRILNHHFGPPRRVLQSRGEVCMWNVTYAFGGVMLGIYIEQAWRIL